MDFEFNEGAPEWLDDSLDVAPIKLPLHTELVPHIAKATIKEEKFSPDEMESFLETAVEHYSIQVHFLENILKSIGVNVFFGYHVSTPEDLAISIEYSEDIKEFVQQRNIKLPHLPI